MAGEGEPHFSHARFAVYGRTASAGAEALLAAAGKVGSALELNVKAATDLLASKHLQTEVGSD